MVLSYFIYMFIDDIYYVINNYYYIIYNINHNLFFVNYLFNIYIEKKFML